MAPFFLLDMWIIPQGSHFFKFQLIIVYPPFYLVKNALKKEEGSEFRFLLTAFVLFYILKF